MSIFMPSFWQAACLAQFDESVWTHTVENISKHKPTGGRQLRVATSS